MKKLLLAALISIALLSSCGNSDSNRKSDSQAEVTDLESMDNDSFVKVLTYNKFLKKVWDFEKYTDTFMYAGNRPCVIDFYADWCRPCQKVAPIMEKLAKEFEGKVDFYKINTDDEQKLSMILKIRNIPSIFFIKGDEQPIYSVGAYSEEYYRSTINKMLCE